MEAFGTALPSTLDGVPVSGVCTMVSGIDLGWLLPPRFSFVQGDIDLHASYALCCPLHSGVLAASSPLHAMPFWPWQ